MTETVLEPGSTLGVLGGGQLGSMFTDAACRMGYQVAVWDPDADAPAHRRATHSVTASFSDPAARERFAHMVSAVTFEWENVPAELCAWLERQHRVRPGSAVLQLIQDRITQKQFLSSKGLPVPDFSTIESPDRLSTAVSRLGLPVVCKTATTGYDGKDQWTIRHPSHMASVEDALHKSARAGLRWIVETLIPFERELSVLVVRGPQRDCHIYPVVENQHQAGILRLTLAPAAISSALTIKAEEVARQAVTALNGVGVFCVELFQRADGELLINEVAPRPHNSGHYTLDACTVSQFEQQVRILCGLPLGEVRLLSPAAMVNVIGEEFRHVTGDPAYQELLATPGAMVHLYGKRLVRAGRKMGHVTFLADRSDVAAERAAQFVKRLT